MKFSTALLTASCALALAACGSDDRPGDADPPSDASVVPVGPDTTPTAAGEAPAVMDDHAAMAGSDRSDDHLGPDAAPGAGDPGGSPTADAGAAAGADAGKAPATVTNC